MIIEFFRVRNLAGLTSNMQIGLLVLAYLVTTVWVYMHWKATGEFFGSSGSFQSIFAPFYEEMIFRGLILGGLASLYSKRTAICLSSFLFGIWHLKNFPIHSSEALIYQVLYTGLILGPLLAWLALRVKSIWPGVLIHATNNLLSPLSWWIIGLLGYQSLF
ncbi:CPBP family intramembrane metalloprotease [Candidatus Peregrinibacteria bacterium]|nr:MAG: CPBP family intramembrane metalloprotease [Candidatus Peregrinibacteria bacterium]